MSAKSLLVASALLPSGNAESSWSDDSKEALKVRIGGEIPSKHVLEQTELDAIESKHQDLSCRELVGLSHIEWKAAAEKKKHLAKAIYKGCVSPHFKRMTQKFKDHQVAIVDKTMKAELVATMYGAGTVANPKKPKGERYDITKLKAWGKLRDKYESKNAAEFERLRGDLLMVSDEELLVKKESWKKKHQRAEPEKKGDVDREFDLEFYYSETERQEIMWNNAKMDCPEIPSAETPKLDRNACLAYDLGDGLDPVDCDKLLWGHSDYTPENHMNWWLQLMGWQECVKQYKDKRVDGKTFVDTCDLIKLVTNLMQSRTDFAGDIEEFKFLQERAE
jgi:hypothetical protein